MANDKNLFFYGLNEFTRGLMNFLRKNPNINVSDAEVIMLNGNKVKVIKGNYIVAANLATDYFDGSGLGKALFTTEPDGQWKNRGMWAGVFERENQTNEKTRSNLEIIQEVTTNRTNRMASEQLRLESPEIRPKQRALSTVSKLL